MISHSAGLPPAEPLPRRAHMIENLNRQVPLVRRPQGAPRLQDFRVIDGSLAVLSTGMGCSEKNEWYQEGTRMTHFNAENRHFLRGVMERYLRRYPGDITSTFAQAACNWGYGRRPCFGPRGKRGLLGAAIFLSLHLPPIAYVASEASAAVAMHMVKWIVYDAALDLGPGFWPLPLVLGAMMMRARRSLNG